MSSDKRGRVDIEDIRIEDPLDFLSVTEREAYTRARTEEGGAVRAAEQGKSRPARTVHRAEAKVADTGLDKFLSAAVRLGLAVIILLIAYMVWLIVLRPMVRSMMGLNNYEVSESAPEQIDEHIETVSELNLRNAPNTNSSEIIVTVPQGTILTRIAEADGWSTVIYEGQTLYCKSEYVKAVQ